MSVLEARGVAVAFAAGRPVFQGASFVLEAGFYGLVGANGAGKTTLLRALAGIVLPSEGSILQRPGGLILAYCPQDVDAISDDIRALENPELKGRLGLAGEQLERWPTLSPGERKRWQIGAALAREPDILLLDEPTNHLDSDARKRLLSALARFRGIGVVVSHDRAVLERLPRAILRVHAGRVTMHAGNYTAARAAWEQARQSELEAHAAGKRDVRVVEKRLDAAKRTQESASQSTHASSRMKNTRDHDAKDSMRKGRARFADARAGKTVGIVKDALDRARGDVPTIERDRSAISRGKVFAAYERAPAAVLFHLDADTICAKDSDHVVLRNVRLDIARDDRVRLAGPNGAGKTTLLEALLGASPNRRKRVLVLPQELSSAGVDGLLTHLRACTDEERGRVLAVFSALGSDPERILGRSGGLSPGEARKLAFALALGLHVWALVLDEPTNHLDLPTIEKLEQVLAAFPGCIILVTHDDGFAEAVTKRSVNVSQFRPGDDVGV